jgi:hypothetical protein
MLAMFCLRLAGGLIASLALFSSQEVNPRFYRVHFLTALGLIACVMVLTRDRDGIWKGGLYGGAALAFAGSLVWSLERAPAGRWLIGLTALALAIALAGARLDRRSDKATNEVKSVEANGVTPGWLTAGLLADDFTSAAVLGTAVTAMLMGHSYLIAPTMSIHPLLRLLTGLFIALGARILVAGLGIWLWTAGPAQGTLTSDALLWLPVRWGVGLAGPLILGWMALSAARIRSTQSATGILYVVVILCCLGELTSQLLDSHIGYFL